MRLHWSKLDLEHCITLSREYFTRPSDRSSNLSLSFSVFMNFPSFTFVLSLCSLLQTPPTHSLSYMQSSRLHPSRHSS